MNIFLNESSGFCFELNFELNHFQARFNEKMNFQNGSARAIHKGASVSDWISKTRQIIPKNETQSEC